MSFDIISGVLASALSTTGTFTVTYPTGRSKGNYSLNPLNHKIVTGAGGNLYSAPTSFTLTFNANASNITVTNVAMGALPAGTPYTLQIEREGVDDFSRFVAPDDRVTRLTPVMIDLGSPNVLGTAAIAASQSVAAGASFLLNGTSNADYVTNSDGSITLTTPRNLTAAWTTTSVLTITGKDEFGNTMIEKSASGAAHTGKKAFKSITSISSSASITSAIVGQGDVLGLPVSIRKAGQIIAEYQDGQVMGKGSPPLTRVYFTMDEVALLLGTTSSPEMISPITGTISKLGVQLRKAVTTGGTVTVKVATTDVTGLTVTVANSDAEGTAYTDTPTTPGDASTVVNKGDRIQVVCADAFATAGDLEGWIDITPTDDCAYGTFVAAVGTLATATTGDVRGTYVPGVATDGTTGFKLLCMLADPADIGVAQYTG